MSTMNVQKPQAPQGGFATGIGQVPGVPRRDDDPHHPGPRGDHVLPLPRLPDRGKLQHDVQDIRHQRAGRHRDDPRHDRRRDRSLGRGRHGPRRRGLGPALPRLPLGHLDRVARRPGGGHRCRVHERLLRHPRRALALHRHPGAQLHGTRPGLRPFPGHAAAAEQHLRQLQVHRPGSHRAHRYPFHRGPVSRRGARLRLPEPQVDGDPADLLRGEQREGGRGSPGST